MADFDKRLIADQEPESSTSECREGLVRLHC
jgi:hypothetical protein